MLHYLVFWCITFSMIFWRWLSPPLHSCFSSFLINASIYCAGKPEADVVVIGSGIGGLCCAGLLARYQQDVLVLESHDLPGGAAHSFDIKGFKFDSGPSLFSGFQSKGPQANPLSQVICSFIFLLLLFSHYDEDSFVVSVKVCFRFTFISFY